jgi:hypothetical protein
VRFIPLSVYGLFLHRERYLKPILWSAIFSGKLYSWAQRESGEEQPGASWLASRHEAAMV